MFYLEVIFDDSFVDKSGTAQLIWSMSYFRLFIFTNSSARWPGSVPFPGFPRASLHVWLPDRHPWQAGDMGRICPFPSLPRTSLSARQALAARLLFVCSMWINICTIVPVQGDMASSGTEVLIISQSIAVTDVIAKEQFA